MCGNSLLTLPALATSNLQNQELIVNLNAAIALSFICHKQPVINQDTIREAGAIPKLIELLNDTGDEICKNVCFALRNLSDHNAANQDPIREATGILPLIILLVQIDSSINPIEQILETLVELSLVQILFLIGTNTHILNNKTTTT